LPKGEQPKEPGPTPPAATPADKPAAPTPPEAPKEEPKPSDPKPAADSQEQPKPEEKDAKEAAEKIRQLSEERKTLRESHLAVMDKNPDYIHELHETNPELATALIKEHWGFDSYEELQRAAQIEDLKATDPDEAAKEARLFALEQENKSFRRQTIQNVEENFFKEKGITNNPYDPKYQALQEAIKNLNPALLQQDYKKGLETAHKIAFPEDYTAAAIKEAQKSILLSKELGTTPGNTITAPRTPSGVSDEARTFGALVGVNI
jgi:hypothetical protein